MSKEITPSETTIQAFTTWSKDLGRTVDEFVTMYKSSYLALERLGRPAELLDEQARSQVKNQLRHEFASPALPFIGRVLGRTDKFDTVATQWASAAKLNTTPERMAWIAKGVINDKGEPLDVREVFSTGRKNPRFGKPLPRQSFLKNVFAVLMPANDPKAMPLASKITLSRDKADLMIPMDVPVQVRLNSSKNVKNPTFLTLTSGTPTEFKKIADPGIPDAEMMIETYCAQFAATLKNLEMVHKGYINPRTQKPDPTRITIIDAELVFLDTEKNATTSNYRMVIGDGSLGFSEEERRGTVVWVPEFLHPNVENAGRGTRMYVIGQTSQPQTSVDFMTGERSNEPGQVGMNAMGIVVKKGWLMPKDEESVYQEEVAEVA